MNARLISLLLLCLRFPLPAQVPASLDPPFNLPGIGITVVPLTPAFLEGLRKHFKLPAYEEDKAVKDKPMIECHFVGYFDGGRSYYFDPNDTTKIITSSPKTPDQKLAKVGSPALLKSSLDKLVLRLKNVKKSGKQLTGKYEGGIDSGTTIIITHHLMTPDRIFIMRGYPITGHDAWMDLLQGDILEAIGAP